MTSLEKIATKEINKYMTPMPAIGFKGLSIDAAVKRVKSNRGSSWATTIDNAALKIKAVS